MSGPVRITMLKKDEAPKGRARERSEQRESGTEPPDGGEHGEAERKPFLFFAICALPFTAPENRIRFAPFPG
jgi:hypothetical protein